MGCGGALSGREGRDVDLVKEGSNKVACGRGLCIDE